MLAQRNFSRGRRMVAMARSQPESIRPLWIAAAAVLATATVGCGGNGTTGPSVNPSPSVEILAPQTETSFVLGDEITFEARASDPEDGELTGEALRWESRELAGILLREVELDGTIGTGTTLVTSDLSFGHHIISVTATNSRGDSATASIEIGVGLGASLSDDIVFLRGLSGDPSNVWVMEPDGSGARSLGLTHGLSLDVSPDGRLVAYERRDYRTSTSDIWIRDVVEGWKTRLTDDDSEDRTPRFSPDGSRILFWSGRSGSSEIFVMRIDGSDVVQLTDDPDAGYFEGDWSPDGSRIVFRRALEDQSDGDHLWLMDADGGNRVQLSDTPGDRDLFPAWSPDGTKIAYTKARDDQTRVWIMNVDGSDQRELADAPGDLTPDELAAWSPDAQALVFTSGRAGLDGDLFRMNVDGTGLTAITENDVSESHPVWVPGG